MGGNQIQIQRCHRLLMCRCIGDVFTAIIPDGYMVLEAAPVKGRHRPFQFIPCPKCPDYQFCLCRGGGCFSLGKVSQFSYAILVQDGQNALLPIFCHTQGRQSGNSAFRPGKKRSGSFRIRIIQKKFLLRIYQKIAFIGRNQYRLPAVGIVFQFFPQLSFLKIYLRQTAAAIPVDTADINAAVCVLADGNYRVAFLQGDFSCRRTVCLKQHHLIVLRHIQPPLGVHRRSNICRADSGVFPQIDCQLALALGVIGPQPCHHVVAASVSAGKIQHIQAAVLCHGIRNNLAVALSHGNFPDHLLLLNGIRTYGPSGIFHRSAVLTAHIIQGISPETSQIGFFSRSQFQRRERWHIDRLHFLIRGV